MQATLTLKTNSSLTNSMPAILSGPAVSQKGKRTSSRVSHDVQAALCIVPIIMCYARVKPEGRVPLSRVNLSNDQSVTKLTYREVQMLN